MSDTGRKGFVKEAGETITPDSQKSYIKKTSENISSIYDRAAEAIQPEAEKKPTQQLWDGARSGANSAQIDGKGLIQSTRETANKAAGATADKFKDASDYVSSKTK